MTLIDITDNNICFYKDFVSCYQNCLSKYMSRIYPDKMNVIKWCYINVQGKNIGSIWLEQLDTSTVKLGVFIAYEQYRHSGYGTLAIKKLLEYAKNNGFKTIVLNVRCDNIYAYKTYQKLGFVKTKQFTKSNGVTVISMAVSL